jgi:hypothetical protein
MSGPEGNLFVRHTDEGLGANISSPNLHGGVPKSAAPHEAIRIYRPRGGPDVRLATHAAQASHASDISDSSYLCLPCSLASCCVSTTTQRLCSPRSRLFGPPRRECIPGCLINRHPKPLLGAHRQSRPARTLRGEVQNRGDAMTLL